MNDRSSVSFLFRLDRFEEIEGADFVGGWLIITSDRSSVSFLFRLDRFEEIEGADFAGGWLIITSDKGFSFIVRNGRF